MPLVLIGALAAAAGRLALAVAFSHLRGHVSARQTANLEAAGKVLNRDRKRSFAGLALFALSPLPSAQLFEAAGLVGVALVPLTAALLDVRWSPEQTPGHRLGGSGRCARTATASPSAG